MHRLVPVSLLVVARTASAQPGAEDPPPPPTPLRAPAPEPRAFVAGGVSLGADHFIDTAWVLEGGVKLPHLDLWLHGQASRGGAFDFEGTGSYTRAVGGVELRSCGDGGSCVVVGADVGFERQTWTGDTPGDGELHEGLVVGPRLGFDAGSSSAAGLRVRGAFELYEYRREMTTSAGSVVGWTGGGELTLSAGYQF